MNVTHDQTPWAVVLDRYIIPASHQDRMIGGSTNYDDHVTKYAHVIARVEADSKWREPAQDWANADFIVKAVNCHEQLVSALRELFCDYRALADSGDAGNWSLEDLEVGKQAMAALAAAGEPV